MVAALKELYTRPLLQAIATQIKQHYPAFDEQGFIAAVINTDWHDKALKARMGHIAAQLHQYLPMPYPQAADLLAQVATQFNGLPYLIFPTFVERYGLDDYANSVAALETMTAYASAEFAVRPFIQKYPDAMLTQLYTWAASSSHHVRRLACEGCRPRLPWAMALPEFKHDPTPILPILEKLNQDDSAYVRRSVANNLNDIAKDNPQVVIAITKNWLGQHPHTDWILKHGCRTLLKQAQADILTLFGFPYPKGMLIEDFMLPQQVNIGAKLPFSFTLHNSHKNLGKLRLEYAIDFRKKNGQLSRKIFKISESTLTKHSKVVSKFHSFKPISTRTYYAGKHLLHIIVNGQTLKSQPFVLNSV